MGGTSTTGSRETFSKFLSDAREASGKSLQEIATVTRIPLRSLELLELGAFEQLPADVFVRGFLRSYARCVDLNEDDAVKLYGSCGMTPAPVATAMAEELAVAMATLEAGSAPSYRAVKASRKDLLAAVDLSAVDVAAARAIAAGTPALGALAVRPNVEKADASAEPEASAPVGVSEAAAAEAAVAEPAVVAESAAADDTADADDLDSGRSRKARRRAKRKRRKEQASDATQTAAAGPKSQTDAPSESSAAAAVEIIAPAESAAAEPARPSAAVIQTDAVNTAAGAEQSVRKAESARAESPRPAARKVQKVMPVPVLRIDDDRPDEAEQVQEVRATREREDATWKSFLPPALLDSEEGSRRGALTLAVIILVIVATLAMSYLLRRPSDSGDGVTRLDRVHTPDSPTRAHEPGSRPGSVA